MKKRIRISGILFASFVLILSMILAPGAMAQQEKETRKEKKERIKKERLIKFKKAKAAMYDTAFVIPADNISFASGPLVNVSSTINYLQVIGEKAVLQIGNEFAAGSGLNNLGGFTLKGNISNLKINEKKNRVFVSFTLTGLIGTARIAVSIAGSNLATVDVDGMYSGRAFTMRGDLITLKEARIFEGTEF